MKKESLLDEVGCLKESIDDSILESLNGPQLWYIYLGLERLDLMPKLKEGTDALAATIRSYGERNRGWACEH